MTAAIVPAATQPDLFDLFGELGIDIAPSYPQLDWSEPYTQPGTVTLPAEKADRPPDAEPLVEKQTKIWRGYPVDRDGKRWCSVCTLWKSVKSYSPHSNRRPGALLRRCRPCQVEAVKNSRNKNGSWPDWQNKQYLRKYGITLDQYDEMAEQQGHLCALCGKPETSANKVRLCIDHDHETGKVRRLLCSNCNRALGLLRDNPALLRAAAAYIESFR